MDPAAPTTDTKERLLDAAERLFASAGVAGTSLRAVTAEAGVNVAAVHYHFGSKHELLRAVFARRVAPMNEQRLKHLDELESRELPPSLEEVVDALVGPSLDFVAAHPEISELAVLPFSEPLDEARLLIQEVFGETTTRFQAAIARCLPGLGAEAIALRFVFAIGAMIQIVSGRAPFHVPFDRAHGELVRFLCAGLRADAAPPAPTRGTA